MNRLLFWRLLATLFFVLLLLALILIALFVNKSSNEIYIEADGLVDSPIIRWVATDKIIYTVKANSQRDSYRGVKNELLNDYVTTKQVNFFNLNTKISEPYKKGELIRYENGEVTIRLYDILSNSPYNSLDKRIVLSGLLGSETRKTYSRANSLNNTRSRFDKCPNDNRVDDSGGVKPSIHLKPEHGCVSVPDTYSKDKRWIYYRADGQVIELTKSTYNNYSIAYWIDWLGAYMIADSSNAIGTLKILTPEGKFTSIEVEELAQEARPTRAGMVVAKNSGDSDSGLRVLRDGTTMQITNGAVAASEVSPDGCKVAYVTDAKLRVVNVCELFDVATDANPF